MGMSEEQDIRSHNPGIINGQLVAAFNTPTVPVREKDGRPFQSNVLFDGNASSPAVTVAGDKAEGQLGIVFGYFLGVIHHVAQVDDLMRLMEVNGGVHAGQRAMGI